MGSWFFWMICTTDSIQCLSFSLTLHSTPLHRLLWNNIVRAAKELLSLWKRPQIISSLSCCPSSSLWRVQTNASCRGESAADPTSWIMQTVRYTHVCVGSVVVRISPLSVQFACSPCQSKERFATLKCWEVWLCVCVCLLLCLTCDGRCVLKFGSSKPHVIDAEEKIKK